MQVFLSVVQVIFLCQLLETNVRYECLVSVLPVCK